MRQWMINPKILCIKHLLGEHLEHHMFVGTINKGTKVDGYIKNNLLEPLKLRQRHDELAEEINNRGYKHKSTLPIIHLANLTSNQIVHEINKDGELNDLIGRCEKCRDRFIKENNNA
jgi:hypothetical protein